MTENELFDMSDEELEAAFKAAKSSQEDEVESGEEQPEEATTTEEIGYSDDDLEQPEDVDSDDNTSLEDEDDDESDEDSDDSAVGLDEDNTDEEEQPEEDEKESEEDKQPNQSIVKVRANGKDYEFSDEEIKEQFPKVFGQAMDYTKKMQAMKPWRKTIDAIETAKLNHDDINLMIDVLKGDKTAVAEVLKRTGVDALELDVDESKYVAKEYGRDETVLEIRDVIERIGSDPEYTKTETIVSKEWDSKSWDTLSKNPNMIELLHTDVKSGIYDVVQPIAEKLKLYDNGLQSDLDYYGQAASIYFAKQNEATTKQAEAEKQQAEKEKIATIKAKEKSRVQEQQTSAKRKAAAPSKKTVKTQPSINYMDDSDEAFEAWYNDLQNKH